jgi:hypothetical protein
MWGSTEMSNDFEDRDESYDDAYDGDDEHDDAVDDNEQSDDTEATDHPVMLVTASPLPLERRRLEDDPELAAGAIVGTYLGGRLIARSVQDGEWTAEAEGDVFTVPRQLVYLGREVEGGTIRAELCALIPAADIPHEPWQPASEHDALVLLGIVVRLPADRTRDDFAEECLDHFETIVGAGAEPVADRVLRSL